MDKENLKLTAAEIGGLWGEYVNGTAMDLVNKYMLSGIQDKEIQKVFEEAISIFSRQKKQLISFIEGEGFPVPIGFTESDLNKGTEKLFSDIFCLHYLHIMTQHGLFGHTNTLSTAIRKDLREFYGSCCQDGNKMYNLTLDLLLKTGTFQKGPYLYPEKSPSFIVETSFLNGFIGERRPLASTEIISLVSNVRKKLIEKCILIGFCQVASSKEIRKFLEKALKNNQDHISYFEKIIRADNLPTPMSLETEVTVTRESPFSDKLIMFIVGFLLKVVQSYHGEGLSTAMRIDLGGIYERIILKNLLLTREWFGIMVQNKWLEQPPLVPNRKEIANSK